MLLAMDISSLFNGQLRLRHFALVLMIAKHGSIQRAAEHLHVTQPVISRGLREIEEILSIPLFERGPRGVTPTVFGETFLEHARAIAGHISQASGHIADLIDGTRGEVTVGTHVAGGNLLLPRAVTALKRDRPYLTVRIREGTPDRLLENLVAGEVDLIVGRLTSSEVAPPFAQLGLCHEPFCVISRRGHPVLTNKQPSMTLLRDYPWVLPVGQTSLRGELLRVFEREGLAPPEQQVECSSITTVRGLVIESDFLAIAPLTFAHGDPRLDIVNIPLRDVGVTVGVTMLTDRTATPSTQFMLAALENSATQVAATITAITEGTSARRS